ncbi:ankyrin repeat protein [Chryseobacterium sp. H1D6B]|uniref:ankyrin repeat domain-containing protein n=1 Tax=Chryseobacterium sp. H1D6B TaxID=2940588 RepID=UPI0015CC1EEF|nr:ankyrin repeat domain-containing protein [Chryseobacterium sp. H1D6B]MDH6254470.1 ankyrin repeat protein [Chryseobacterium sp. H1D6B]
MKKIILYILLFTIVGCNKIDKDKKIDKSKLLGDDYRLFQDTPAWNLAKAVWDDDVDKIDEEVNKNTKIINYQEKKYGNTLLHLSIFNNNYKGFKELLKLGANPNIADSFHCSTPLIVASEDFEDRTKYAEELIKYKANVNYIECSKGKEEQKTNRTALIAASRTGNLKMVKLLVGNGAEIDYKKGSNGSAISSAVLRSNYNIVLYLLKHGADCNQVLYKKGDNDNLLDIYMRTLEKEDSKFKSSREYQEIKELLKKKGCL